MKTPSQYKIPGHKISYATSGVSGGYWVARCSCGWRSQGWHDRKRRAVNEASGHMLREQQSRDD